MNERDEIIKKAIKNRTRIRFRYGMNSIIVEPYFYKQNISGKQTLYGRIVSKNEIGKFDFDKINDITAFNLRRFSPIIPITQLYEKSK